MSAKRPTLQRGLLAGLLALITFASGAVAMTARGSGTSTATAATGATPVISVHDGDGGGRQQEVSADLTGHHR
jgi:hypothetical protein